MSETVRLDTHVILWVMSNSDTLSPTAAALMERSDSVISPMVELELTYLYEIGKITQPASRLLTIMSDQIGLRHSTISFEAVVHTAENLSWTRDPFDRLITADAIASNTQLITKDQVIRHNCSLAVW